MSARRTKTGEVRLEDGKQGNRQREMAVHDARGGKWRRSPLINALKIATGSASAYANARDRVASGESRFIILTRRRAVALRRDDGDLIGGGKRFDHAGIGIERLVGDHDVGDDQRQKRVSTRQVMRLSRGEQEPDRVAERVDQRVDLRAQPAFAAPDRFVCAVFFGAPALCW